MKGDRNKREGNALASYHLPIGQNVEANRVFKPSRHLHQPGCEQVWNGKLFLMKGHLAQIAMRCFDRSRELIDCDTVAVHRGNYTVTRGDV